jgi:hypothetical protein
VMDHRRRARASSHPRFAGSLQGSTGCAPLYPATDAAAAVKSPPPMAPTSPNGPDERSRSIPLLLTARLSRKDIRP